MSIMVEDLNLACAALRRGEPVEAEAELTVVLERLTGALAQYESTLDEQGIPLPYAK
ncbi:hypothetical protein ACE2AJ_09400 [Aquihabitans daechungensis]|uniref:hypothetical protein n=1 Tax=Aquihabitans daechungensis TaxID=1052257 RepID=UPI003BA2190C